MLGAWCRGQAGCQGDRQVFLPQEVALDTRPVAGAQPYGAIVVFAIEINHASGRGQQQFHIRLARLEIRQAGTGGAAGQALSGTDLLEIEGDLAAQMVEGINRFLQRQLEAERAALLLCLAAQAVGVDVALVLEADPV